MLVQGAVVNRHADSIGLQCVQNVVAILVQSVWHQLHQKQVVRRAHMRLDLKQPQGRVILQFSPVPRDNFSSAQMISPEQA